jgi:hypothetical protein
MTRPMGYSGLGRQGHQSRNDMPTEMLTALPKPTRGMSPNARDETVKFVREWRRSDVLAVWFVGSVERFWNISLIVSTPHHDFVLRRQRNRGEEPRGKCRWELYSVGTIPGCS